MAYWSSEKLKQRQQQQPNLVEPFEPNAVKHGAYELALGPEAFLTSYDDGRKRTLSDSEQVVIPPGQFGLLLTEEHVSIPTDAIGFISIKAGVKFRGLVNVSGFHVDPGFTGRLKFSVYNAGSRDIIVERRQRVFLLWFSDLDQATTDAYSGSHANQNEITPDDVMRIQGKIASPGQLKIEIQDLQNKIDKDIQGLRHEFETKTQALDHRINSVNWKLGALLSIATGLLVYSLRGWLPTIGHANPTKLETPQAIQTNNVGLAQRAAPANQTNKIIPQVGQTTNSRVPTRPPPNR